MPQACNSIQDKTRQQKIPERERIGGGEEEGFNFTLYHAASVS